MARRMFAAFFLVSFILVSVELLHAQRQSNVSRIGILRAGAPTDATLDLFLMGLRERGYVDGKNVRIEIRYAEGKPSRADELAKELVGLRVDALFTSGTRAILSLKQATRNIPIVMVSTSDPVATGMVSSLANPRGNITGMSLLATDLWPKRLELLKEISPKLSKAAIFWNKSNAGMSLEANATLEMASHLGVTLQDRGIRDTREIEATLEAISKERPDAFLALMDL